ncbi:FUSC family protein [Mycobacterium shigaense]|uniref:Uncharacterized protein n=1 Tax=Mycobacterium shigaense TaxID=722731 RepID=A0A1Z4EGV5_9MYCO|nr:FUSC family protein [Mycobacterium shigaense]MEA1122840.1 FUSC family protein [Mycobacterium shigaense]PRI13242.1 hypothetical protein B2J96_20825 [Mycobacterium shigaense]BAX92130.1 hypothetical protein MSG_01981 [Mycobacterium shigaense]
MSSLLTVRAAAGTAAAAAFERLRGLWFTIAQTSVASALAWYIAADLLKHPQPFFAPIASAVCLSISNVLRGQRAVQMIIGVALGIWMGAGVQRLIGTGVVQIGIAVLLALCVGALVGQNFIGQGMMFVNQTVVSSILVLALYHTGPVSERIDDALIGGGLAIVFAVLLFPADPLRVLSRARIGVLEALQQVLSRTADVAAGRRVAAHDWPLPAVDRVHEKLGDLLQARATARQVVRLSPRRWRLQATFRGADHQAVHVALLASSVLQLARVVVPAVGGCCDRLPQAAEAVLVDLAKATSLADSNPVAAITHVEAARVHASVLLANARERTDVVIADVVQACVDDLQRVIDLRPERAG